MIGNTPFQLNEFLSTPSARRATGPVRVGDLSDIISIHALREEGDLQTQALSEVPRGFLSTPSARRATFSRISGFLRQVISIHALREEGDLRRSICRCSRPISIHALREEGDHRAATM